jgi:release factor glutamine methyltransferase
VPLPLSPADRLAVIARLRGAGCVFAEDEAALLIAEAGSSDELTRLVDRRTAGEPLEHVLGWAEFSGLRIAVARGVFVPRRRSEFLVAEAVALGRRLLDDRGADDGAPLVVVDLCCGSGAVGLTIATALDSCVELHVADVDPGAVGCAAGNVAAAGGRAYAGDLYEALPGRLRGRIDLLVVNAPYVPTAALATMPAEARLHEPPVALDGGADGLDVQRRVAADAPHWLAPDGHLLIETSRRQIAGTQAAVSAGGLVASVSRSEDLDATVVVGSSRAPALD